MFSDNTPSKHQNIQMSKNDVKATSKIANVRIYVEQAIKWMKDFHILKMKYQLIFCH